MLVEQSLDQIISIFVMDIACQLHAQQKELLITQTNFCRLLILKEVQLDVKTMIQFHMTRLTS